MTDLNPLNCVRSGSEAQITKADIEVSCIPGQELLYFHWRKLYPAATLKIARVLRKEKESLIQCRVW